MYKLRINAARVHKATDFAILANAIVESKKDKVPAKVVRQIGDYKLRFYSASNDAQIGTYMDAMARFAEQFEGYCKALNAGANDEAARYLDEAMRLWAKVEKVAEELTDDGRI